MSNVLPDIGLSGVFIFSSPFDSKVPNKLKLTVKAVRKISDYLASSEDVKQLCYVANDLTDEDYNNDLRIDMEIVSFQSGEGQWFYIPASYIITYPLTNGIPYRSLILGINLPQLPVTQDLTFLETDIRNLVKDHVGITPTIDKVETSAIIYVATEKHDTIQASRNLIKNNRSYRTRLAEANIIIDAQTAKIQDLENYIKNNLLG